jgi:uncharacterized protein (TIGR03067 family)
MSLVYGCCTDDIRRSPNKASDHPLHGTWIIQSAIFNGVPLDDACGEKICFTNGKMTHFSKDGNRSSSYRLNPSKTPAAIDIVAEEGLEKGKPKLGIYEVNDQRLKLCVHAWPNGKRPESFASKEGSGVELVTLTRAK